jgi:four helix bundle protein
MAGFQELKVWQLSKELAVSIYKITNEKKFKSDFGLTDQIRRALLLVQACSLNRNI